MIATEDLYSLLPAVFRLRDADRRHVLEELVAVLAEQADVLDRDIADLYENWFVETCEPWVVAYIGDLLRVRDLYPVAPGTASQRAYVANTLGYRRRKGTVGVLEELAYDVTGWRAKAVEFFQLLGTTQYAKHVRPGNLRTPDLRVASSLELLGGPFEDAAHALEARRIPPRRGRYNVPNVGLYVWRLQEYPLERVTARRVGAAADGRFTASPLGLDGPLFNLPRDPGKGLVRELHVPAPLRRRALFDELEAIRQALVDGREPPSGWFASDAPVLRVFTADAAAPAPFAEIPREEILVADLELWQRPPTSRRYLPTGGGVPVDRPISVAVDPARGRMTFPTARTPDRVEASYAYGFAGDLGGGPYDRALRLPKLREPIGWQVGVGRGAAPEPGRIFATLVEAVQAWNAQPAGTTGAISILDSRSYVEDLTGANRIEVKDGSELLLVAAEWPDPPSGRRVGDLVPKGLRPHVLGAIEVVGVAPQASEVPGTLAIDGLLVEGSLTVASGNLGRLSLVDTTFVPASGGLTVASQAGPARRNSSLRVELERAICGPISLAQRIPGLRLHDSIVDAAGAAAAVDAPGAAVDVESSTLLGTTTAQTLNASDAIFRNAVVVSRRQTGCVRFSFVPREPTPITPRRYRCQPDLALDGVTDPRAQANVRARLVPTFTSTDYGRPGYGQLAPTCPPEIVTGADDGSEMGAFSFLKQPQRLANLGVALDEYLRFGLEAGVFHVT